jgi:hypothetical protein
LERRRDGAGVAKILSAKGRWITHGKMSWAVVPNRGKYRETFRPPRPLSRHEPPTTHVRLVFRALLVALGGPAGCCGGDKFVLFWRVRAAPDYCPGSAAHGHQRRGGACAHRPRRDNRAPSSAGAAGGCDDGATLARKNVGAWVLVLERWETHLGGRPLGNPAESRRRLGRPALGATIRWLCLYPGRLALSRRAMNTGQIRLGHKTHPVAAGELSLENQVCTLI